ncbi:MAG: tetratricopeptide repeat protein [Opitutaceae bacterium]
MSEVNQDQPLQRRRTDLIIPPEDPHDERDKKVVRKKREFKKDKPVGILGKCFLVLLTIATFSAIFQSEVLWTPHETVERTSFRSMTDWSDAWTLDSIKSNELVPVSTYFWEQSIPLPTPIVHRAINLLLHILAALLLLKCLEQLRAPAAYAATLIFALHPAALQTIFWPGYRTEFLGLILILAAIISGIHNRSTSGYIWTLVISSIACLIHPAATTIPIILAGVILLREKSLHLNSFNRVLPIVCIALFVGVWTSDSNNHDVIEQTAASSSTLHIAGESMFFYIKQSLFPINLGLFHPLEITLGYKVTSTNSILPFLFFIPLYALCIFKIKENWARGGILGLTAFLVLSLHSIHTFGTFIDGREALENHSHYIALPAIMALIVCTAGHLFRIVGSFGKLLWRLGITLLLFIQIVLTASFANSVGQTTNMWKTMNEVWPDSWIVKSALIESAVATDSELLTSEELIKMLTAVLDANPELIEERKLLARLYSKANQNANAVKQYKRILRDSKPDNEFLEEAARLYDKVGMEWDARNARERIKR